MKRSEAPPPGWYPDPTGRSGLLWWDGLDWTTHHRPPPVAGSPEADAAASLTAAKQAATTEHEADGLGTPTAAQLRSRTASQRQRHRDAEREVADAVAEARRVAKSEVERAVQQATAQLTQARQEWQPRLLQYARRAKRWLKVLAVVVVLFVLLSTWANATLQTSLLEWIGERIDAATATTTASWPMILLS